VAGGDGAVGAQQDDGAVGVVDTQDQHLGPEPGDPAGWEVDHADHGRADQLLEWVAGDLGAGHPLAEGAQVEAELVGGPPGLRELLDGGDHGRADVDGEELLGLDGGQDVAGFGCLWHER
jgi:hypothetical protein